MYKIKQIPQDFIVDEISNVALKDSGKFSYFKLVKKNKNTIDSIKEIAKELRIREKQIGFAGSKDKHAVTSQVISIENASKNKVLNLELNGSKLEFLGFGNKPVSLGDLDGNKFEIIVRNLGLDKIDLNVVDFIVNYFDEQRFSKNNTKIGKSLIKKDFSKAVELIDDYKVQNYIKSHPTDFIVALKQIPLRLLRMYVNSYQSYLWNEVVYELLRKDVFKEVEYSLGKFVFVKEKKEIQVPLIGYDKDLINKEFREVIEKLMKKEEITHRDFIIKQIPELSLEGEMREVFVDVNDFKFIESDDELNEGKKKVTLKFGLGKGSYATLVVKSIFS